MSDYKWLPVTKIHITSDYEWLQVAKGNYVPEYSQNTSDYEPKYNLASNYLFKVAEKNIFIEEPLCWLANQTNFEASLS